ncbi:kinase-like domain-containing protein [Coprinopsis sp. MPI-PUGE-AT-0042]|nr:kinase-like domain-containing protein [Coprinopsis sp. MPI-PUGE-AT-0042]
MTTLPPDAKILEMAPANLLFSQHSSNPLEAHPSDTRNVQYNTAYQDANERLHPEEYASSSDPLAVYPARLQAYHQHLAAVVPGLPLGGSKKEKSKGFVDLDGDEDEDEGDDMDELNLKGQKENVVEEAEYDEDLDGEWEIDPDHETVDATVTNIDGSTLNGDVEEIVEEQEEQEVIEERDYFELDEEEELNSLDKKTEDEVLEINKEISEFYDSLPQLSGTYRLIDRLGTGTFSSVYKALDLKYHGFDNMPWLGFHPPMSSAHFQSAKTKKGRMVFVAIKRIYVTSGPERIRNELAIMEQCRGARHVAIIMPYQRNEDFREYFECLPMEGIKAYFRCLLRALRDIHARGIIHRDVKPANFLFDPATGQGTLCDFGLAQTFDKPQTPAQGACLHTHPSRQHPHGTIQTRAHYDEGAVKAAQMEARSKSKAPSHSVGVPAKDTRMPMKANRAGTRGFRAPEVLLKCGMQSGAVDVWSAGIILLFFLTRKFPLFQSNDDVEALMEIAMIFGRKKMEGVATLHARKFSTNVPDLPQNQMPWDKFVEKVNPEVLSPPHPNEHLYPYTLPAYREKLARHLQREGSGNDDEGDQDGQPQERSGREQHDEDDDDLTPRKPSLKRKEREDDDGGPGKDAHPNGRRRTTSYSSSPLRFPESSPAVHKPTSRPASAARPPSNQPSNRSSSGSHPHPSTSPSRQDTDTIQPPCPPLETPQSYEDAIYHAMDLVSKLLEPEAVRRITPAAALAHPFLLEEVPDPTGEGGGTRIVDDDDYVPHLFGEGVCGEYHFWDEVTEQGGVVIRRRVEKEEERGSSAPRESGGSSGVTKKRVVRRRAVKEDLVDLDEEEDEEEAGTSDAGRLDEDEEVVPTSEGEAEEEEDDQWEWEEVTEGPQFDPGFNHFCSSGILMGNKFLASQVDLDF